MAASRRLEGGRVMFVVKHTQEMANKTFRFPVELLEQLERIAQKNKISVNSLVMQMSEYALENMEGK
jgi:predicted HicB family RNase H-like nuclease